MNVTLLYVLVMSLGLVFYAYAGYAVLIYIFSRLFGGKPIPAENAGTLPSVRVLVSALNEEDCIGARVENVLSQDYPADRLQVTIASDGSTDRTAAIVQKLADQNPGRVGLLDYPRRRGKATVLNDAMTTIPEDIVVLSDANTFFETQAIRRLCRWFADQRVGVVCGRLVLVDPQSGRNVDSLYWRYETFLKECEGHLGALLGSNGAIYAIRRECFSPIPPDTIIDDFVIPLQARINTGKVIVYDADAVATEETPAEMADEFRRRARIGAGGFQSLFRLWRLLLPTYGWTTFAFWSHKVLRWFCPAFMFSALAANLLLVRSPPLHILLAAQIGFYLLALAGRYLPGNGKLVRVVRLTTLFTSMNLALVVGFWRWLIGRQRGTWQRTAR